MKFYRYLPSLALILLSALLTGVVSADMSPSVYPVTGKVYVSSTTFDPAVFFTGDKGTVTYVVTNSNANSSVVMNHATFAETSIRLLSSSYDSSSSLGPLQNRAFTFSIFADAPAGDYYPTFSMSFYDASLFQKTLLQVDNTPLDLTITDKPDAFMQGKKKTLYLQVANPRKNNVRNVALEISGDGITATPDRSFIGDLAAGAKTPVNVSITPDRETTLVLHLTYDNGNNPHELTREIPITFGTDKKQANPVMSNVQVTTEGTTYHVTGDVNNAGLETANTVTVTALAPAVPEDPYKTYVVGALKTDDFGSFEITFGTDGNVTSIPVQVSFKDSDGNIYSSVQNVTVPQTTFAKPRDSGLPLVPIVAGLVIVAIFVGGWYFYLRKNKK